MKKLIIASIAAAIGLAVNAATVDWQIQITGATAADAYQTGYTAYLVNAAAWDAATITAATFTDNTIVLDSTTFNSGTGKSSKTYTTIASGTTIGARSVDVSTLTEGNTLNVYYVILNGNADPNTYTAIADTLTGRSATGETALGANYSQAKSSLSWSPVGGTSPVPEPTSGLLMLLGVAGLALRRRRA